MSNERSQRVAHRSPGEHDVEKEITSSHNDKFILHDSEGVEDLHNGVNGRKVDDFIERRRQEPEVKDQLHAIWYVPQLYLLAPFRSVV